MNDEQNRISSAFRLLTPAYYSRGLIRRKALFALCALLLALSALLFASGAKRPSSIAYSLLSKVAQSNSVQGSPGNFGTPDCSSGACTQTVGYTPTAGYTGPGSFPYESSDGAHSSNTATVS